MSNGSKCILELFNRIIGETPTRFWLGHGSFLTIEFGRDLTEKVKSRRGIVTRTFGEWRLWICMCAWRIDQNGKPLIGCETSREGIKKVLLELPLKPLTKVEILSNSFDAVFYFGDDIELRLFIWDLQQEDQWMLFTPENKVFAPGPGASWSYDSSKNTSPEVRFD